MESKYKELRFETVEEFEKWLKEIATQKLTIEDHGQDFRFFLVDERGEILHTLPCHGDVWNGMILNPDTLSEGEKPKFIHPSHMDGRSLSYPIEAIEALKA